MGKEEKVIGFRREDLIAIARQIQEFDCRVGKVYKQGFRQPHEAPKTKKVECKVIKTEPLEPNELFVKEI
jgi:hypothetical protein